MDVVVDKFGRILIPKQLRRQLGVEAGSRIDLNVKNGQLTGSVGEAEIKLVRRGRFLVVEGLPAIDFEEAIREARDERDLRNLTWPASSSTPTS